MRPKNADCCLGQEIEFLTVEYPRHKNLRIVPGNDHITFLTEPLDLTLLSAQERRECLHKSEIRETVNKG